MNRWCAIALGAALAWPGGGLESLQERGERLRIAGRVIDAGSGLGVAGARVALLSPGSPGDAVAIAETVTDRLGLFALEPTGPADWDLVVSHLAYGTRRRTLAGVAGDASALRVTLSAAAIELEPVTVRAPRRERFRARPGAAAGNRVTADELAAGARSGATLAATLAQLIPGVRTRSGRSQPGALACLEFRGPASLAGPGCLVPIVVVDRVRQANGLVTLNTLEIRDVQSVEALPPGEAGVRYGANANAGAIVIETRSGARDPDARLRAAGGAYDWALESRPYPWLGTFAAAAVANAAGLFVGYTLSDGCLRFESLSAHLASSDCGFARSAASRLALYGLPQAATGWATARFGSTDLSRGDPWKNALAAGMVAVPGLVLALTREEDGFPGSRGLGVAMVVVGAPLASTLADRLFRRPSR